MIISNDSTQCDVEIDTFILQPMDELNLLGVLIDRNLLFSNHISSACKKAGMWVSVLMRMRNMISMKVKLRIYTRPPFCHIWHTAASFGTFVEAQTWESLRRLYNWVLWAVFCSRRSSYDELLTHAWMTSLYSRCLQDIAILMYKVKFKLIHVAANIIDLFSISLPSHNLRNWDFFILKFNTVKYGRHSIRYLGPIVKKGQGPGHIYIGFQNKYLEWRPFKSHTWEQK